MSALVKPMVHSSRAIGNQQPVNAEKIIDFVELETTSVNNTPTKFQLVFSMEAGTAPKSIIWNYSSKGDMNADFAGVLGLVSTVAP